MSVYLRSGPSDGRRIPEKRQAEGILRNLGYLNRPARRAWIGPGRWNHSRSETCQMSRHADDLNGIDRFKGWEGLRKLPDRSLRDARVCHFPQKGPPMAGRYRCSGCSPDLGPERGGFEQVLKSADARRALSGAKRSRIAVKDSRHTPGAKPGRTVPIERRRQRRSSPDGVRIAAAAAAENNRRRRIFVHAQNRCATVRAAF